MDSRSSANQLSDEELDRIMGGVSVGTGLTYESQTCPSCSSSYTSVRREFYHGAWQYHWSCNDCGYVWLIVER